MPNKSDYRLLPRPRRLETLDGKLLLKSDRRIILDCAQPDALLPAASRLQAALKGLGVEWNLAGAAAGPANEIGAHLRIDPTNAQAQGYRLKITSEQILLTAGDAEGAWHGVSTLIQILEQSHRTRTHFAVDCISIDDWPDFPVRGVMLDISRDKVPTMETLYGLVEMLASWKINQLQLYTEHTFTYRNHPEVWADASPMTEQEILELDAFCRERMIELVPNQNSFGHMRRWLVHPRYRDLAECPDGCDTDGSGRYDRPFSLNPTDPRSLEFVASLYAELLPNFTSRQLNVGCDETLDLGRGRSAKECDRRGVARVYLDFLLQIHKQVQALDRVMQYWGDIIVKHPELIPELPKDAIALEWGYEANHPFDENGAKFSVAGVPFYVCPGTATWNSIAGRTQNAMGNLLNAAENGIKHGAIGYLNTDWGDNGHWQVLPASYLGFAYGAAVSWCLESNRDLDVAGALNQFAFRDRAGVMGKVAFDLGNVYQALGPYFHNASGLVRHCLMAPTTKGSRTLDELRSLDGISTESFDRAERAIRAAIAPLPKQKMERTDAKLITSEYRLAADLLLHACAMGRLAFIEDEKAAKREKKRLDSEMKRMIREYKRLWLARNRKGGLRESAARLENVRRFYQGKKTFARPI